jgi:hypothetical protein
MTFVAVKLEVLCVPISSSKCEQHVPGSTKLYVETLLWASIGSNVTMQASLHRLNVCNTLAMLSAGAQSAIGSICYVHDMASTRNQSDELSANGTGR